MLVGLTKSRYVCVYSELRGIGSARIGTAVQRWRHQFVRDLAAVQQAAWHQHADQETQHEHSTGYRGVQRLEVAHRRSVSSQIQHRTEYGQPCAGERFHFYIVRARCCETVTRASVESTR